jgi:DNA-binding transcriptional MerR regulator
MMGTEYTVKEFAKFTGVTERTLRYYDKVGLLKPSNYSEKGHRLYQLDDLGKVQKILTLKYLGYSLSEIKKNIKENSDNYLRDTLNQQKEMLIKKREEIDAIIQTISEAEELVQGNEVSSELLLTIIHSIQHEQIQKRFFAEHMSKDFVKQAFLETMSKEERFGIEKRLVDILSKYHDLKQRGLRPEAHLVQELTKQLFILLKEILTPELKSELDALKDEYEIESQITFLPKEIQTFIEEAISIYEVSNNGLKKG